MHHQRSRKTKDPCPGCGLHRDLCLCDQIPALNLKTRLCLIIHRRELKRTTNTGMLAVKSLLNSTVRVRGEATGKPLDLSDLLVPEYRSLLFYPTKDAQELTPEFLSDSSLPVQLLVPDGNWRQASKVHARHPELQHLPKIKISSINSATQHLRAEHSPEGMSTLEAIAKAMAIIEGPEVGGKLLALYQLKLRRTLQGRGQLR